MRFICNGDSFTHGTGMDQTVLHGITEDPHPLSWPYRLSELSGIKALNISDPGASAKEIAYRYMQFHHRPGDVILTAWTSGIDRNCAIHRNSGSRYIVKISPQDTNPESILYYDIFPEFDSQINYGFYLNYVKMYYDNLGIKNFHFATPCFEYNRLPSWCNVEFETDMNYEYAQGFETTPCNHLGPDGQLSFAKRVFDLIKDRL